MNERAGALPERRTDARISAKGALIFRAQEHEQRGRIANMSVGGVFALTTVTAPDRLLARKIDIEVRLDAGHQEWWKATGHIVRVSPDGVALAFDTLAPALLRTLDELATASRAHRRVVNVVLIDADAHRRDTMSAGFRATGCAVVEAATSLEAIVRLGEASFEPDVIAIADSDPSLEAADMRLFVERDHPRVKLITIGDDVLNSEGFANWLSAANPDADLATRVRDALIAPHRPRMTSERSEKR
jgi:CheY-like chemotaxis protein